MSNVPTNKMRQRIHIGVLIGILLFAFYITINLFNIAVVKAEYYRSKANSQQLDSFTINANRGTIYDTNGKILAQSSTVWDVIINPGYIAEEETEENKNLICKTLSEILGVDYDKLIEACKNTDNRYYIVKTKVDKPLHDQITQFQSDNKIARFSITLNENTKRYYPNETLASSIIGFTNYDNDGVYGIEAYYDEYLQGVDGKVVTAKDAGGKPMPYEYETRYEAQDGNSVYLTIDEVLQHYLEKNLETVLTEFDVANRATGIIMNVNTGAVLAMATAPGYDLNNPAVLSDYFQAQLDEYKLSLTEGVTAENAPTEEEIEELVSAKEAVLRETQWNNKAISELYFPGSVFKVVTCASALEEQVVGLDSEFYCSGSVLVADTTKIRCWSEAGHGLLNLQNALIKSCNPSFIAIGGLLGADKFCDYFEAFGFTEKTGVDLPGEASPLYVSRDNMGIVELASSSFGQTNKITVLQMATAYCAVINGGYLVTPYLVEKIVDNDGNVIKSASTQVKRQVISSDTSELMRELLENVVEYNGGSNAYISGYRIGGKSGTSEKLDLYNSANMRYVSSFSAFTPANDPEIVMLVIVDEPIGGTYYGSAVAAPVVSTVLSESLEYMGFYAQYTAEELAVQDTVVPYIIGSTTLSATTTLNTKGLNSEFVGDESGTVKYTVPATGATIPKGGTVVIYLEETDRLTVQVPNVIGMTVTQANTVMSNAGLNISLSGGAVDNVNATATSQSIEAGTEVYKGAVIEVVFALNDETG